MVAVSDDLALLRHKPDETGFFGVGAMNKMADLNTWGTKYKP